MSKHKVCHVEWSVEDLQKGRAFYEGLFGWQFREFGDEMMVFGDGDSHIGGLVKKGDAGNGSPSVWIEVEDVEAMLQKAESLGGRVASEKRAVPSVGWSAQLDDPEGNRVGIVQFSKE